MTRLGAGGAPRVDVVDVVAGMDPDERRGWLTLDEWRRQDGYTTGMATEKQRRAAKRNVKKAIKAAKDKRTIAHLSKQTRSALGKQGAAVARRKRTGAKSPKTRQELYEIARRRNLPGRSRMGRAELARALGEE